MENLFKRENGCFRSMSGVAKLMTEKTSFTCAKLKESLYCKSRKCVQAREWMFSIQVHVDTIDDREDFIHLCSICKKAHAACSGKRVQVREWMFSIHVGGDKIDNRERFIHMRLI